MKARPAVGAIVAVLIATVGLNVANIANVSADMQAVPAQRPTLGATTSYDFGSAAASVVAQDDGAKTHQAASDRQDALSKQASAIHTAQQAAQAKKKAADEAERKKIAALGYKPGTTDPREIARQMMKNKYGWGEDQFRCYDKIIVAESNWKWWADNPTSSAYGIPQALPGSKMASAGPDWRTNPATQIKWGLGYVKQRYGTPCKALAFRNGAGWY